MATVCGVGCWRWPSPSVTVQASWSPERQQQRQDGPEEPAQQVVGGRGRLKASARHSRVESSWPRWGLISTALGLDRRGRTHQRSTVGTEKTDSDAPGVLLDRLVAWVGESALTG